MNAKIKDFVLRRGMPTPVMLPLNENKKTPLISCIMPTYNRDFFVQQSIKYFLSQDYPHKELIIADDGTKPVIFQQHPGIYYLRLNEKKSVGYKRNLLNEHSRGEIIAHWDDDDWYHPSYLTRLYNLLVTIEDKNTLVGLGEYLIYILKYRSLRICHSRRIAGATFFYHKTLWASCPFRDVRSAEDFFFFQDASPAQKMLRMPEIFIVIRHSRNTWSKEREIDVTENLCRCKPYYKNIKDIIDQNSWEFYRTLLT